jgi:ribosomal protein S18 acetylase RimI-like enzyme
MIAQPNLPMPAQASAMALAGAHVSVRAATRKDRGAIRRIECASFGRGRFLFGLWPRAGAREARAWLALVDGKPAGYLIAYHKPLGAQRRLYVGGVGVLPALRGQHIGEKLMLEALLLDPATWLHVRASNAPAIRLYERLGMRVINRAMRFYSNGEDALVMSRVAEMR